MKRINMQIILAVMLILLLLLPGCGLACESISAETPSPTPTETPIPIPTITPTLYWPPEIVEKIGEELPELGNNDVIEVDGIFLEVKDRKLVEIKIPDQISARFDETAVYDKTAGGSLRIRDSLYTAVYKDGEWQFNPIHYTSFESKFLEATLEKYYRKENTPNSTEEALQLLKSNPNYTSRIGFINFHGDNPPPNSYRIFSLFAETEYISMEGQPGVQPGDLGLVGVLINPVFPEGMPVFLGVQRGDDFIPLGNIFNNNKVDGEVTQIDNSNVDNVFGHENKLVESFIMYACKEGNLKLQVRKFGEIDDLRNRLVTNPNGYLAKYTSWHAKEGYDGRTDLDNLMKEFFNEMNTSRGGDVAFYTVKMGFLIVK